MLIRSGTAKNFGSYAEFSFDFAQPGLHLISGATGSGKSTICDLVPWVLFGRTAKNGLAGDILSWNANGDTTGTLHLSVNGVHYVVYRSRGKVNDLWYSRLDEDSQRGKDVTDTQKMLCNVLGVTPDQYLVSGYYHELSNSAQFFFTTAKNRRQITEQLVDLSEVIRVHEGLSDQTKEQKKYWAKLEAEIVQTDKELQFQKRALKEANKNVLEWDNAHLKKIQKIESESSSFETIKEQKLRQLYDNSRDWRLQISIKKEQIFKEMQSQNEHLDLIDANIQDFKEELSKLPSDTCDHCGQKTSSQQSNDLNEMLVKLSYQRYDSELAYHNLRVAYEETPIDPYEVQIAVQESKRNLWSPQMIENLKTEVNPHLHTVRQLTEAIRTLEACKVNLAVELDKVQSTLYKAEIGLETVGLTRQQLIEMTMREVENETNKLLESYFESLIRIEFISEEFDKLDVNIFKDGNVCSYTQLSKGQKQLLKLCFGIACMKTAANRSNVRFEQIFIDEGLDGLDDELKVKSFYLLEALCTDYTSIYIVEHNSELKNMFTSRFEVTNINGNSTISKIV